MPVNIRLKGNLDKARSLMSQAKSRLREVKEAMSFQGLKQLYPATRYLPDGSSIRVGNVFGIDHIEIVGVSPTGGTKEIKTDIEIDVVFIVYRDSDNNIYASWKILNDVLTPESLTLEDGTQLNFFDIYPRIFSPHVKSNEAEKIHYYTMATDDIDYINPAVDSDYGMLQGVSYNVLIGNRNCWIGDTYDLDTTWILSVDTGAKRSAYMDTVLGQVTGIECRGVDFFNCAIYYTVDLVEYSTPIPYNRTEVEGVISPTKAYGWLGQASYTNVYTSYGSVTTLPCGIPYCINQIPGTWANCTEYTSTTSSREFYFGDIKLAQKGTWVVSDTCASLVSCNCQGHGYCATHPGMAAGIHQWWTTSDVTVLDYDVLDFDNEGSFILIFARYGKHTHKTYTNSSSDHCAGSTTTRQSDHMHEYQLMYRFGMGTIVDITLEFSGDILYTTATSNPAPSDWCGTSCAGASGTSGSREYQGTRAYAPNCIITSKYMLYTYGVDIVSDGGGYPEYTYSHRVIGTINLETGAHTQNIVDDAFLGAKNVGYDLSHTAAIGLHRKQKIESKEVPA